MQLENHFTASTLEEEIRREYGFDDTYGFLLEELKADPSADHDDIKTRAVAWAHSFED